MITARTPLWLSLATLILTGAALDAVLIREKLAHWPTEPGLFATLLLLWTPLALLALLPAWLLRRRLPLGPTLAFTLTAPLAAHAALDSFTQLGSSLSEVLRPAPIAAASGAVLITALAAWGLARLGRRLGARTPRALAATAVSAIIVGCAFPRQTTYTPDLPDAPDPRPDVLLVVLDTVRERSAFGQAFDPTPFLTELSQSATRYTNARSVSCFTFTSHLSMLTGVYPSEHRARMMDMRYQRDAAPHVADLFARAGYRTGAFVGTNVLAGETGIAFGFETYDDRVDPGLTYGFAWALIHDMQSLAVGLIPSLELNGQPHWIQDYQRPAEDVLPTAAAWLAEDDPRPSFAMINLYDVHWPYLPEPAYEQRVPQAEPYTGPVDGYAHRSSSLPDGHAFTPADNAHLTRLYHAELLELDDQLRAFLGQLDLDRTALIITSDHGEAFGEGGRYEHSDILEPQVEIPFVVRAAGGSAGHISDAPVTGLDVAPTLLGLAGLDVPAAMRGHDLTQTLPVATRERLVEDRDHFSPDKYRFALYRERFKRVLGGPLAKGAGLFDLSQDRDGLNDASAQHPELAEELAARLHELRAVWAADDTQVQGTSVEGLGALGYLDD